MAKTVVQELAEFGQSIWLDNINRFILDTGKLKEMIDLGLRGMTSNPTIFDKAISSSSDYDGEILKLSNLGKPAFGIYDDLTIKDIQGAADAFMGVYENTRGLDGYVSLEINPQLAFTTQQTIEEGKRLYQKVARPNVMFKVPATEEGFKAIEELIACGININITLIFSVKQYTGSAHAYIRGLKRLMLNRGDLSKVRSVASVFVSRIDTVVDNLLDEMIEKEKDQQKIAQLSSLKGRAAVANSGLIYKKFLEIFSSPEFKQCEDKDANLQRVLWGSTSTKNPAYSDIKYVAELIAKNTVNTMPENTFESFLGQGRVKEAIASDIRDARRVISSLENYGIDIDKVCAKLLEDGVIAFEKSFASLLRSLEEKAKSGRCLNV